MKTLLSPHPVQIEILKRLITNPSGLRYCDMKDAEIENDRYNYHLQYLVDAHLVQHRTNRYWLSDEGRQYILEQNPIDLITGPIDKFKVAVLALVIHQTDSGLEVLYQQRACEPSVGRWEMVGGSVRKGESVVDAAKRRLLEESGLIGAFTSLGLIRKIRTNHDEVVSDILYHVCVANNYAGNLVLENQFGQMKWVTIDDVIANEVKVGSRQLALILRQIKANNCESIPFFYIEEQYSN